MRHAAVHVSVRAGLLLALAGSWAGCYGAKLVREPVTIDETAADVRALREQQSEFAARLRAIEELATKQEVLLRAYKAEDQARADELKQQLLAIDSKLGDALNRRSQSSAPPTWSRSPEPPPILSAPGGTSTPADSTSAAPPVQSEHEAKRIYDQAFLDQGRGNYTLAILGFREFLRHMPDSDLADNAQYWVGEAFYAQRDFEQAVQEFLKVPDAYPKGDKVPAALLKIGYSFIQIGDKAAARRYLNQVVEEYPNSEEATLAKSKLRSLQ